MESKLKKLSGKDLVKILASFGFELIKRVNMFPKKICINIFIINI